MGQKNIVYTREKRENANGLPGVTFGEVFTHIVSNFCQTQFRVNAKQMRYAIVIFTYKIVIVSCVEFILGPDLVISHLGMD